MTQASGHRRSMSLAQSMMTGSSRIARKMPPGPIVSPEHMRMPYFSEIVQSMPRKYTVRSAKLSTTKSAPGNTSFQSLATSSCNWTPVSSMTISARRAMRSSRPGLLSTSASVPWFKCGECTICQIALRPKKRLPAPMTTTLGCWTPLMALSSWHFLHVPRIIAELPGNCNQLWGAERE